MTPKHIAITMAPAVATLAVALILNSRILTTQAVTMPLHNNDNAVQVMPRIPDTHDGELPSLRKAPSDSQTSATILTTIKRIQERHDSE